MVFRLLSLFSFSFILSAQLCAQGFGTIEAKVLDSNSAAPLVHSIVFIKHTGYSATVNEDGVFRLIYPKICSDSTLVIGAVGYSTVYTTPKTLLQDSLLVIKLDSLPFADLTYGMSNAKSLIKAAVDSIKINYPANAFKQDGFFRETAFIDSIGYVKVNEAQLRIERFPNLKGQPSKTKSLADRSVVWQGQLNKLSSFGFQDASALVTKSFETTVPEFLSPKKLKNHDFTVDSLMVTYLDKNYLKINFQPARPSISGGRVGSLLIDPETKVIPFISYEMSEKSMKELFTSGLGSVKVTGQNVTATTVYYPLEKYWTLASNEIVFRSVFEDRLDRSFKANAEFKFQFSTYLSNEIRKSSISKFDVLLSTNEFKATETLSSKAWGKGYYVPASSTMLSLPLNKLKK